MNIPEEKLNSGNEQLSTIARRILPAMDFPEAEKVITKIYSLFFKMFYYIYIYIYLYFYMYIYCSYYLIILERRILFRYVFDFLFIYFLCIYSLIGNDGHDKTPCSEASIREIVECLPGQT